MTTIMPGEEQLLAVNEEEFVLTTRRIHIDDMDHGSTDLPLEQVNNVNVERRGYRLLLFSGVICLLLGITLWVADPASQSQLLIIAGVFQLIFWWATRSRILSVASDKGAVSHFDVDELSDEDISVLVDDIQIARNKRLNEIKKQKNTSRN
ncbi:hypothetical protein [Filimonas effusa]|uniref:Uncharacterized protein n=1 Tax=Filimonas effusa TaxID=2508721 RepID=A0A4Q1D5N1_9BACT|nr:hypothetical protein [Filimonas effusa]RXK83805.1 hypothetical protein ESB13_17185 [Filimonas effusa]